MEDTSLVVPVFEFFASSNSFHGLPWAVGREKEKL